MPQFQFSLRAMLVTTVFFALACGVTTFCFSWPKRYHHDYSDMAMTALSLWMAAPVIGWLIGGGVGTLINKTIRGGWVGFGVAVLINILVLIYSAWA